jgi:hypothetical protein
MMVDRKGSYYRAASRRGWLNKAIHMLVLSLGYSQHTVLIAVFIIQYTVYIAVPINRDVYKNDLLKSSDFRVSNKFIFIFELIFVFFCN